jgi:hypothetical protein
MKRSLNIMIFVATLVFIGACDRVLNLNIEIPSNKAEHCKRYRNSNYDINLNVCYVTVDKPVTHPENPESLAEIFKSTDGGKPKCTVHGSMYHPIDFPFVQRVTATCDNLNLDITFNDSINDFSQKVLNKAAEDEKICSRYANANACEYKYLDKYCMRDWNKPLVCNVKVSIPTKHPEDSANLSKLFKEQCEVIGWKLLDLNNRTKQQVFAICNGTQMNIFFEHAMTEKEIAYEECTNTCKNTYGSFPAVSLKDFDGTCVCQDAEEDDDELAKLGNIHNKKMSMLQSMINVKHL